MTVRAKLLAAQLPLVAALLVTLVVGTVVAGALGRGSASILKDNYRSVLAAQNMLEAAERIDSGIAFLVAHRDQLGRTQIAANVPKLEGELRKQEDNITEPGEREATTRLRAAWKAYRKEVDSFVAAAGQPGLDDRYFGTTLPMFQEVKAAAGDVLAVNQDAMSHKSDEAQRLADRSRTWLVVASVIGLLVGAAATSVLVARTLRPLNVLAQTARRLGEGDVAVRARVERRDEIGDLARELNTMADRIQKYRASSLGELLEAQLAAQATIDSLPDPVLVVGLDGAVKHANQAAEAVQGDAVIRAAVDRMRAHVAGGQGAFVPKGLDDAFALGDRMLLPRAAPLYAQEGDVAGVTIVLQDVTRLRRFEELRNDLVATVAHELRTPLTSLRMAVHLLAEQTVGPLTEKQGDLVFAAREECDRLQGIVDELLDLSRISAGAVELRIAPADPEMLVAEAVEGKGERVVAEALPGMPEVAVDRERIQLVFANLIGNALKYGPPGGKVTVRARPVDGFVRFEVHDEGPGVPAEYRDTVFDKYVRVPDVAVSGSGMGLYIAREVVKAHGGDIGIDGSTFWFILPTCAP